MAEPEKKYFFRSSERGIFVEIYFPKRAAYYAAIFNALRFGYDENEVKIYLRRNAPKLVKEFQVSSDLLNPRRYTALEPIRDLPLINEARERIDMYRSPFYGWSTHSVDGVFFDKKGNIIEEATQLVRIIFRFKSSLTKKAIKDNCFDVLRAIIFWIVSQHSRLYEHKIWSEAEKAQFMVRHEPWPEKKRTFAEKHYVDIAIEIGKQIDDQAIFIFGYLVRKFWENVVKEKYREDEIWVTNFFDLVVNVLEPK